MQRVTPDPASTKTLLRCIYVGRKYPHIYTLGISTGKNQSTKVYGSLYIPIYEYNCKVITRCDTILQENYITDRPKCENTKRYTKRTVQKSAHELQKVNSRDEQGAWKDGASDGLPKIHALVIHF